MWQTSDTLLGNESEEDSDEDLEVFQETSLDAKMTRQKTIPVDVEKDKVSDEEMLNIQ